MLGGIDAASVLSQSHVSFMRFLEFDCLDEGIRTSDTDLVDLLNCQERASYPLAPSRKEHPATPITRGKVISKCLARSSMTRACLSVTYATIGMAKVVEMCRSEVEPTVALQNRCSCPEKMGPSHLNAAFHEA
jgi:hypothetical protein